MARGSGGSGSRSGSGGVRSGGGGLSKSGGGSKSGGTSKSGGGAKIGGGKVSKPGGGGASRSTKAHNYAHSTQERSHKMDWGTYNTIVASMPGPSPLGKRDTDFRRAMNQPANTPRTGTYHNHFVAAPREREIQRHIKSGYKSPLSPGAVYHNKVQERAWDTLIVPKLDARLEAAYVAKVDAHFDKMHK
ncbi:hypothetical protein WJX84_010547 [Apatococcus fuscideae]|uniref:Uncharacterized protein n=1 Tax=Apatococcus fuscideae TaxID=2026836 RepID=A0AAW1TDG8_9CHLO